MTEYKAVHVTIIGKVQGVFFRAETRRAAMERHLKGYVKNMPDGSVQALFQGKQEKIDDMLVWCEKGSPLSSVDRVIPQSVTVQSDLKQFDVLY
ncbi:MAG: acylphosphatase [Desulfobacterales bacterium]|nr:acylphosphatase [Desulfobacterales bacterium]